MLTLHFLELCLGHRISTIAILKRHADLKMDSILDSFYITASAEYKIVHAGGLGMEYPGPCYGIIPCLGGGGGVGTGAVC